jgi:hypothetical protein
VVFKGNATKGAGQFKLNCENNSHGITIKGPPHSAAASYTLTLPNTDGNADQVLKTDGSGGLSWVDPTAGATGPQGPQGETGPQGPAGPAGADGAGAATEISVYGRTLTSKITEVFNRAGSSLVSGTSLLSITARSGQLTLNASGTFFIVTGRTQNYTIGF